MFPVMDAKRREVLVPFALRFLLSNLNTDIEDTLDACFKEYGLDPTICQWSDVIKQAIAALSEEATLNDKSLPGPVRLAIYREVSAIHDLSSGGRPQTLESFKERMNHIYWMSADVLWHHGLEPNCDAWRDTHRKAEVGV